MLKKRNALFFMILSLSIYAMEHDELADDIAAMEEGRLPALQDRQLQVSELALRAHIKNKDYPGFKTAYEEIQRMHQPSQMRRLLTGQAVTIRSAVDSVNTVNPLLSVVDDTQNQAQKEVTGVTAKKILISFGCVAAAVLQYYAQSTGQQTAAAPAPNASASPTAGTSTTSFTIPSYIIMASIGIDSVIEMIKGLIESMQNKNLAQIRQLLKEQQEFYLTHQQYTSPIHQPADLLIEQNKPAAGEKPATEKKHRRTKKKFKRETREPN